MEIPTDIEEISYKWMQIVNAVARGRVAPEEGVTKLQALADNHPDDRRWLQDEIETIRRQFALDVIESIQNGQGGYWDQLRSVIAALLDERLDHDRALELLRCIDTQHPEQTEQTARLISGLTDSPLRRLLETDE